MLLSAIINTYERPESLKCCLEHLAALDAGSALEVIVIDDGSSADYRPALAGMETRLALSYTRMPHAGLSAARNAGVALARAPRIWFLGDDVMVSRAAYERHVAVSDPHVALLGPYPMQHVIGSPPFRHWCEVNPLDDISDPANARYTHFITGNLSMDRAVFHAVGGFDERYKVYGWEDLDLGILFEDHGGRVVLDPAARATHEHPRITRAQLWRRERWKGYTGFQFYEKWKHRGADFLEPIRIWPRDLRVNPGPAWRLRLGAALAATLDAIAPASPLNWRVYERMVHACRLRGFAEAMAAAGHRGGTRG